MPASSAAMTDGSAAHFAHDALTGLAGWRQGLAEPARDVGDDRLGRRDRVRRASDRPADHEVVGAGKDRLARRRDPLLVRRGAARQAGCRA